jgi:hypothetical protein
MAASIQPKARWNYSTLQAIVALTVLQQHLTVMCIMPRWLVAI